MTLLKRTILRIGIGLAVVMAAFVLIVPAPAAAIPSVGGDFVKAYAYGCQIKYTIEVYSYANPTFFVDLYQKNGSTAALEYVTYNTHDVPTNDGTLYRFSGSFRVDKPYITRTMRLYIYAVEYGDYIPGPEAIVDTSDADCSVTPDWYFSVDQLGASLPEANVPATDGSLACGLFDVLSWGEKVVDLSLYPDCQGDVTVYCLNNVGEWTANNVSDVAQSDGVLTFTSSQDGTCGIFPAP